MVTRVVLQADYAARALVAKGFKIPRRQLSERGDNRRVPEPILVSIDIGSVKFRFG